MGRFRERTHMKPGTRRHDLYRVSAYLTEEDKALLLDGCRILGMTRTDLMAAAMREYCGRQYRRQKDETDISGTEDLA